MPLMIKRGFMPLAEGPDASVAIAEMTQYGMTSGIAVVPGDWWLGLLKGVSILYGAVDIYSGVNRTEHFQLTLDEINSMVDSDTGPYNRFQLELAKRAQELYYLVGMGTLLRYINKFRGFVGDPPLPEPDLAFWSLRGVHKMQAASRSDGLHLSDLFAFWEATPPKTAVTAVPGGRSLRAMLA